MSSCIWLKRTKIKQVNWIYKSKKLKLVIKSIVDIWIRQMIKIVIK